MRGLRHAAVLALLLGVAADCHEGSPSKPTPAAAAAATPSAETFLGLDVYATASLAPVVESFFAFSPELNATVRTVPDPVSSTGTDAGSALEVAVVADLTCKECYELTPSGSAVVVHAGDILGAQYGLAELLEATGVRFFHPWQAMVPTSLASPLGSPRLGQTFQPQMTLRGLHLHTLHPIESYFAFWASNPGNGGASVDAGDTSATGVLGAERVIDWIVKNRGNYVEWSALNDIVTATPADLAAWQTKTGTIIDYAHSRGITIGIGTELFGVANLQNSFDLLDDENDPTPQADVDKRWNLLVGGLPWDIVDISFGEFTGSDPNVFLTSLDLAYTELEKIAPGTTLAATVHVGNDPSLIVTYDGTSLLYYFLVKYANPNIVPWIHTVMYFDLFQPADGAYNMPNFDQHLAYLESRLKAGQPVGYYPESAYWIAFDDSVPTYLPLYIRSRWLDMTKLASASAAGGYGTLRQHVTFSSGWEWGYWQNDYAILRMNFEAPASWTDPVNDMFAPWGQVGADLAAQVGALGELQNQYLIGDALAPYIAGEDAVVQIGWESGIISQPVRTSLTDVSTMDANDRATFVETVVTPLGGLDSGTAAIRAAVQRIGLPPDDPWLGETADGIAIDADRAHFVFSLYQAVVSFSETGSDAGWLAKADAARADAQAIVARRDARLHYPAPSKILGPGANSTTYQSGYLTEAASLCYWSRERIEAASIIEGSADSEPSCLPGIDGL